MKKILAFAGSNSSTSINHALILNVTSRVTEKQIKIIRLDDYPLPIFSEDLERDEGFPSMLKALLRVIKEADAFIISVNEHNGSASAFFKNVMDWLSRIEYKFLADKKVLLFSASTGKRGGLSSYEYTKGVLPRYGAVVVEGLNFPSFAENFSVEEKKITNDKLDSQIDDLLANFVTLI
jgi:chromate reductase